MLSVTPLPPTSAKAFVEAATPAVLGYVFLRIEAPRKEEKPGVFTVEDF